MKLEMGAGHRGTRGYLHHDAIAFPGIDIVAASWDIDLPDNSVEEVLALGFVEHLTYFEALDTFRNVYRMLEPGGLFLFDVPDYPEWARLYLKALKGEPGPFSLDDIRKTLFGWGRWPGDEHKYGWDYQHLVDTLRLYGFSPEQTSYDMFRARCHRDRFSDPENAHLYMAAYR